METINTTETAFPRMHASLYVSDLEKTVNFYNRLFDQLPAKIKPGYAKYELKNPALIISFVENPERVKQGFGHFGIQVATLNEVKAKMARVQDLGLPVREEMGTACCYALQDKFWVTDPDGAQWEIYYFHEDVAFNDPQYQTEAEACCAPAMETATVQQPVKQKVPLSAIGGESCSPGSGCC